MKYHFKRLSWLLLLNFFNLISCCIICKMFHRVIGKVWQATIKNDLDLSFDNLSVEDAIELVLDRPLWSLLAASRAVH